MFDETPGVAFDAAEESVAPGQACVLYDAREPARVLGGGFIAAAVRQKAHDAATSGALS
jgi:tRNA-specific 2-thiouridylase